MKNEITEERVRYIADLARLQLTNEEIHRLSRELGKIIHYIDSLNELETSGVDPTYSSLYGSSRIREDIIKPSMLRSSLLDVAPRHDDESVLVPVIISTE